MDRSIPYCYCGESNGLTSFSDGVTRQEFCDCSKIENIVHRARVTGVLPTISGLSAISADEYLFSDFSDACHKFFGDKYVPQVVHSDNNSSQGSNQSAPSLEKEVVSSDVVKSDGVKTEV